MATPLRFQLKHSMHCLSLLKTGQNWFSVIPTQNGEGGGIGFGV